MIDSRPSHEDNSFDHLQTFTGILYAYEFWSLRHCISAFSTPRDVSPVTGNVGWASYLGQSFRRTALSDVSGHGLGYYHAGFDSSYKQHDIFRSRGWDSRRFVKFEEWLGYQKESSWWAKQDTWGEYCISSGSKVEGQCSSTVEATNGRIPFCVCDKPSSQQVGPLVAVHSEDTHSSEQRCAQHRLLERQQTQDCKLCRSIARELQSKFTKTHCGFF